MPKTSKPKSSYTKRGGKSSNRLRIVGGEWRSRQLKFPDVDGLRPSTDRVRETLFNWLSGAVEGCRCLDLFCGSGALGLEALSRGAKQVDFVDTNRKVVEQMRENLNLLQTDRGQIFQADANQWLKRAQPSYDLVFLDPPFNNDLLAPTIETLESLALLHPGTLVYIEAEKELSPLPVPAHWLQLKERNAGQLSYYLFEVSDRD